MSLVDLAGSERTSRTNSTGDRRKEAGAINKSLSVLRDCIQALRHNQTHARQKRPKFNESRLTKLFEKYLTGHGVVRLPAFSVYICLHLYFLCILHLLYIGHFFDEFAQLTCICICIYIHTGVYDCVCLASSGRRLGDCTRV